ncbi:TonB-dependent hemoglobin/transferrin/lactoferrin family receptor [Rhodovulum strictum]|uniref:TonB-dependent hemoglobin/transferrin/lactoferrin family receptor n=1 Tax=Rhodovulum strictum TaxID=58314 RepID=A0A844BRJ3_9RHOB|nr:TonB-dependent hemoglobin/transferrin/lactoferrin family receptor [Rhodovulum strictum]MRH22557.1 TonB-dependent hemoglobin/transferrin/lactoferrin family receptor [Rhodovulum strictum]
MRRTAISIAATIAASGAVAQDNTFVLDPIFLETAFRDQRALLDTPVSASVRAGEELQNRQASDIQSLIGDMPGVTIYGGPRAISQEPNIRGFRDQQIVLRFDGGRFNYNQGHRGRFFIDPDLLRRVEVVRGGGSTLYGSGALGGVIAFETVDAADLLAPGQTIGARIKLGYTSNGQQWNGSTTVFADWGDWDALLFLGGRNIGADLKDGSGNAIPFSQIDQTSGMVKIGYQPTEGNRLEFSYSAFGDDGQTAANSNGIPTASNPLVDREARTRNLRLSWDYAPEGSELVDMSVLFHADWLKITEDRVSAPRRDETRYDTLGLEITNRSKLDLGLPVELVYGLSALRDTQEGLRNGAPRPAFPDAEATTFGAFAEATAKLAPGLDLIAGLRFDRYERKPDGAGLQDVSNEFWSPRIGLSYRPTADWQIYGNLARAYRAPSLTELYNSGMHFPGNFFVPNPDLEPEESTQIEIGARFERGGLWREGDRLAFSVNAYHADVDNYIEQVVNIPGGTTNFDNADGKLWGVEAELDYDAQDWFIGAGLGIARGQRDDGQWLGAIPQDRLTASFGLRPMAGLELGARATFAKRQDRVPAAGTPGDSYELLDLYATWAPGAGPLGDMVLRVGIDNVFDRGYTIYPNGLEQSGRSVSISTTFTF